MALKVFKWEVLKALKYTNNDKATDLNERHRKIKTCRKMWLP